MRQYTLKLERSFDHAVRFAPTSVDGTKRVRQTVTVKVWALTGDDARSKVKEDWGPYDWKAVSLSAKGITPQVLRGVGE